jgi:hypothetical protein
MTISQVPLTMLNYKKLIKIRIVYGTLKKYNEKKRKVGGKLQYFIKWQDYDDKFNSWVIAEVVRDLI